MDIRSRILARPDLAELRASRDIDKLAAALNAEGLKKIGERWVTGRTILGECPDGEAILIALEEIATASPATRWTVMFLQGDPGVDMGRDATIAKTDQLVADAGFPLAYAEQLKALALQPLVVTRMQVNDAMFNPDGTEK